ncbi:GUN4 domain-containing protein [Roseofilum sp. BLCC_M154]|uniref:GUN4 domain-containing protein n=1 Tax=Roseofilum acuticapitatum BLCC-M154 TaxID=3022444 RepID=A0ABT7AV04_9CYAN|nr:GUN4 domain-containing protein [Roseofilum acuticapitatum]MDJ1170733.1 GUN4 domain-containing protein [Roseofilum acuticapitatum BLCC-M154]
MANPQLRLMILAFPLTSYVLIGRILFTLIDLSSHLNAKLWNWAIADRQQYPYSLKDDRGLILGFPLTFPLLSLLALSSLLWCTVLVFLKTAKRESLLEQVQKRVGDEALLVIALPAECDRWFQGLLTAVFEAIEGWMAPETSAELSETVSSAAPVSAPVASVAAHEAQTPEPQGTIESSAAPVYPTNPDVPLRSETGIDYTRLRDLLAAHKWQESNQETLDLILRATRRESDGWLDALNLEELPCTELDTINQLWVAYSQGQFGLSVQSRIYEQVGGDYSQFGDRIGWRKENQWTNPTELNYTDNAPPGHLPYLGSAIAYSLLIHKLKTCGIQ